MKTPRKRGTMKARETEPGSALPADAPPATQPARPAPPPSAPPYWGADLRPDERPGVPRETAPHPLPGAHWREPPFQPTENAVLQPAERDRLTPVYSTALPPRGLSGIVRRAAHLIPDHRVSHWLLLLVADRIDVLQSLRPARKSA